MTTATTSKSKPAKKFYDLDGRISVSIWKKQTADGTFYNVEPNRRYEKDDQWKDANSYPPRDALALARLMEQAYEWVCADRQAGRDAQKEAA
jgi:hypothetical protein